MSRQSQPTWLAPCPALAARINPGILPKDASDVTYVQSSFICGNKACSFRGTNAVPSSFSALRLPQWQQSGATLCGTEAPSLLAPPGAAPPTVAPSGDSTEPRPPLEPAHHLRPRHRGCLRWHRLPERLFSQHRHCLWGTNQVRAQSAFTPWLPLVAQDPASHLSKAYKLPLVTLVAIGGTALSSICFSSAEAAFAVVTATCNPFLYGT